jgi:cell division septal protein FtsQ
MWEISTKIKSTQEATLLKSRKNKKSWIYYLGKAYEWFRNYLRTIGWVFLVGIVGVFFFILTTTPFFQLKPDNIDIVLRPEPVFDRNAIGSIMRDFAGKNVFSISTQEVFQSLSASIRHIASVEKTILLPDGIRVTVTSFAPSYRAFIGEEVFLLTENGQLIADIPEVEAPALEIWHLISDPSLGKSTPIMIEDMAVLRELLRVWRENLTQYPINALKFYDQEKEIHIVSNDTLYIFSLGEGVEQINTLIQLIQSEQINTARQYYIDMRLPKRVYTCARDEWECAGNITRIYGS